MDKAGGRWLGKSGRRERTRWRARNHGGKRAARPSSERQGTATSTSARMSGRLVLNGATEIRGSLGEVSGAHVSEATALWLHTMVALTAGDTVELQGNFRAADGYFAADQTSFWGAKIG